MRRAPAAAAELPRGERVEGLAERLCRLRPADTPAEVGATLSSLPGATPPPESRVSCDFLAPPQATDEIGRLGEYRVLRVLGTGGMGVVFLAEDTRLSRRVALKTLRSGLGRRGSSGTLPARARAAAAISTTTSSPSTRSGVSGRSFRPGVSGGESSDARLARTGTAGRRSVRIGREMRWTGGGSRAGTGSPGRQAGEPVAGSPDGRVKPRLRPARPELDNGT
jgi:hypothetical protein